MRSSFGTASAWGVTITALAPRFSAICASSVAARVPLWLAPTITGIAPAAATAVRISSARSRSSRRLASPSTPRTVMPSTPRPAMKRTSRSNDSRSRFSLSSKGVARIGYTPSNVSCVAIVVVCCCLRDGGILRRAGALCKGRARCKETVQSRLSQESNRRRGVMDMPVNQLKRALREGRPQVGCWLSLASHASAEICAGAGFDWVLVDTEHAPADLLQVHHQLHAIAAYPVSALVRPYWNDTVVLKRLLDIGVQSFVIPYVQSAEEAKRAVAAVRYPPRGARGVSTNSRSNRFGRVKDYFAHADNEI